jgi:exopolysaccharide production protein ExoZ
MNRLVSLDYLRGICAFGIMIYNYTGWGIGDSNAFMGRVGIFGVSIFYILSGLTLHHVYNKRMKTSGEEILFFFKKRVFRIFPLLWLATIFSILLLLQKPDWLDLFLNLTGLFGFFKWDSYFAVGAWSIGNELVFYVFFPIFLILSRFYKFYFKVLVATLFIISLYFAFFKLDVNFKLADQWKDYVNPFNQVFLFLGGFLIYKHFSEKERNNSLYILLLILGVILFIFYPVPGNSINLVTGFNKFFFMAICFSICISFYKINMDMPDIIHRPLSLLGAASYSVYLLHPIVISIVGNICKKSGISGIYIIAVSVLLTLIISYFVYEYFEKYFVRIGNIKNE